MARNTLYTATAVVVMTGAAFGADYLFPSANPPGGKSPSEVPQFISIIWDDNGYSGEVGTSYEPKAGEIKWDEVGYVGGMERDWTKPAGVLKSGANNPLNINEGDMGLSWAVKTLGSKMSKGTGHMTFNMISGLFIPQYAEGTFPAGEAWKNYTSEYGKITDGIDQSDHKSIAVSWGREQKIGTKKGDFDVQESFIVKGVNKMLAAGHEVGNHTIDHLETNSVWPENLWPNSGDGFDNGTGQDAFGNPWNEKQEFAGQNAYAYNRGWKSKAGYVLESQTWTDILTLGEQDYSKNEVKIPSAQGGRLQGFRAPRLEINSNMFTALAEKGYLYDCGVEEGMEWNRDGTNFLWPYTVDNGVPNFTSQAKRGETIYANSFPTAAEGKSIWEIPVNLVVVPENIRADVLEGHNKLVVDGEGGTAIDIAEWDGKITGFDFNMFILWAMTKEQVVETMKHTLDLHYNGNRAPMQVGCHTDYFTPMYDFATLTTDAAFKYSLPQNNPGHGNTWEDRKAAWEAFVDYGNSLSDAQFVSGRELIEKIKGLQAGEEIKPGTDLSVGAWQFVGDDVNSADKASGSTGNSLTGNIEMGDDKGDKYAQASYTAVVKPGSLKGLTHISMDYNTSVPLSLRFYVAGDNVKGENYQAYWEVTLDNKFKDVASGEIPLSAFHYGEYTPGEATSINAEKIDRIEVAPVASAGKKCEFSLSNIKVHGTNGKDTEDPIGDAVDYPSAALWKFMEDDVASEDIAGAETFKGNSFEGHIKMNAESGDKYAYASYVSWDDPGYLSGMTHIKLDYKCDYPLEIQIYVDGDNVDGETYQAAWEITLPAQSSLKSTGALSLKDFAYDQYGKGTASAINSAKINGIGIAPQGADKDHVFTINNIVTYGTSATPISGGSSVKKLSNLAVNSISNGSMKLTVPAAGVYNVELYSPNGRLVKSINKNAVSAGAQSVNIQGISNGIYLVRVVGNNAVLHTKALIK